MQIRPNKDRKSRSSSSSDKGSARRAYLKRDRFRRLYPNDPIPTSKETKQPKSAKTKVSKEDALIDLYEDPFKKTKDDEQLIINIDFSKPLEILGRIYQQIKDLLRVAQSKITKDNGKKIIAFVRRDRKTTIYSGVGAAVLVIALGYSVFGPSGKPQITKVQGETTEDIQLGATSDFDLLYPTTRKESELPLAKISPPGSPAAYTYVDRVEGVEVQVTQQELPDRFKTNQVEEFKNFAVNFAATTEVKGSGFTAYLGVSVKGPQSVVMIKNDRLVLLKSASAIPDDKWATYLSTLQQFLS